MSFFPIQDVLPERQIVFFAPHYDDFLLGLGGYILEMRTQQLLANKEFHIVLIFSRSNYQIRDAEGNADTSLERVKLATGRRLIEELNCLDELLGERQYRYELLGERECLLRAKALTTEGFEFPYGTYSEFNEEDWQILARMISRVRWWAAQPDTALVFPLALREHIDHFITRESGCAAAQELGRQAQAHFYFQEDKPYAGLQTPVEAAHGEAFIRTHGLQPRVYRHHPEQVVEMAFKHYISQVEDVYREGILRRSDQLSHVYGAMEPCDQLFAWPMTGDILA